MELTFRQYCEQPFKQKSNRLRVKQMIEQKKEMAGIDDTNPEQQGNFKTFTADGSTDIYSLQGIKGLCLCGVEA